MSGPGTTISLPCFNFFHCFMALLESLECSNIQNYYGVSSASNGVNCPPIRFISYMDVVNYKHVLVQKNIGCKNCCSHQFFSTDSYPSNIKLLNLQI